jgi:hypothetical protein
MPILAEKPEPKRLLSIRNNIPLGPAGSSPIHKKDDGASGSDWSTGNFTGEEPFRIEFLSQETTTGNPFYLFGYILANRILSPEDISLPVDISKARS